MTLRRTVCSRDCPDTCTILAEVEGDRVTKLRGDPEDPITRGFLCERTGRFLDRQYSEDRITRPLLRRDGRLEPVSWDAALDLAAEKLDRARREQGGASILHYRSGGSLGVLKYFSEFVFARIGPVTVKRGDICAGAGDAAQRADFGISESHDPSDLLNSRLVVLWGKNPHTSGVHLLPFLKEARARGARIVGIDPVRTKAAQLADLFLMPRPGADFAVAMAAARHLFETGGVDPDAERYCEGLEAFRDLAYEKDHDAWAAEADLEPARLEAFCRLLAERRPVAFQLGWGLGRRRNGMRTMRALDGLAALCGSLGVPGGGVSFGCGTRGLYDKHFGRPPVPAPRSFSETRLGAEILEARNPPVRALWVTAGNPVAMLPDSEVVREAFRSVDFKVVVDTHPTDTTDVADLVLPTLTLLEDDDVHGAFGNHWFRSGRPVTTPPGEARHEVEILQDLARRLGHGEAVAGSIDDWKRRAMGPLSARGIELEDLDRGPVRSPFSEAVLFRDRRFPTPSGRVRLLDRRPAAPPRADGAHPMTLLAVSTPRAQSSQWSVPVAGPAEVRVHPSASAGFEDGARAALRSAVGRLEVIVRHDEGVRPDVALMEKGGSFRQGRCVNALVRAVETDEGEGAAYYDEGVRLEPLDS